MSQTLFSSNWLNQFTDPYAVLGVSVAADERRVLKRYRTVAKLLHPDSYANADPSQRDLASQLFARMVNPAYQKLKLNQDRSEYLAMLRFRVRRMSRDQASIATSNIGLQLLKTPLQSLDIIYEQSITQLAELQYQPLEQFEQITSQLEELNLVYFHLKMGEPMIQKEKRTGIVPVGDAQPIRVAPTSAEDKPAVNYAQRHYQRAQEYMKKSNWSMAVQELRDGIRIEPTKSEYHSLLAKAYLMQNLQGMATVHFRQALKLNPNDPLALEYAKKMKIDLNPPLHSDKAGDQKSGGLFGMFAKKR